MYLNSSELFQLLVIIHRIESFTVSDPLIKFVTGIEMLWQVIQVS